MSDNPIERLRELAVFQSSTNKAPYSTEDNIIDMYFDLFLDIASKVNKSASLKGNVLLNKILPSTARSTEDLDFSITSKDLYDSAVVPELEVFGSNLIKSSLASRFEIKDIQQGRSGGIKVYDSEDREVYSVDVSLSKLSLMGVFEYNFDGKYTQGSSIEKILCDKSLATLSSKRFRRMKDFYDLYIILNSDILYDPTVVFNLMIERVGLDEVKSHLDVIPFSLEIMDQASKAWSKLILTRAVDGSKIEKPEFPVVITKVYELYDKLIDSIQ